MTNFRSFRSGILALSIAGLLGVTVLISACLKSEPAASPSKPKAGPEATAPKAAAKSPAAEPGAAVSAPASDMLARVWPMFGGSLGRNMVNTFERNLPAEWELPDKKKNRPGKNIKWSQPLGSQSYGNPVVSGGKIFLGTNNDGLRNPRDAKIRADGKPEPIDKGNVFCFRESDGRFLWQAVHDKLESGRVNDWPLQGVCSSPFVEGERVYYVNNRCELICADTEGFYNGNQGVTDEKYKDPTDADIIWRYDMMEELGVFPHNLAVCSPLVVGDLVFVVTGNGHDESHENIPAPRAPSFIAVDKNSGKLAWEDASPGDKILHGQWSNPTYCEIKGQPQIIFPGGDGWLRAFDPKTGKLLWKFDCNPKASVYILGGRGTRNEIIATPVVHDGLVYVAVGQDPEHGEGVGHLWCIDPSKASPNNIDLSPVNDNFDPKAPENKNSGLVWHHGGLDDKGNMIFRRSISTCAVADGLCYAANLSGFIDCLDAKTGQLYWRHDMLSAVWGSPYVVDGKVYIGTDEGDVYVFAHSKEKKLLAKNEMDGPTLSTPIAVNGVLYVMTRTTLFAISHQ
jgi:outer membrane protein assembly factor BamB